MVSEIIIGIKVGVFELYLQTLEVITNMIASAMQPERADALFQLGKALKLRLFCDNINDAADSRRAAQCRRRAFNDLDAADLRSGDLAEVKCFPCTALRHSIYRAYAAGPKTEISPLSGKLWWKWALV